MFKFIVLFMLVSHCLLWSVECSLTSSQHNLLKKAAQRRIAQNRDLIPKLVQMSFHDCVGGCDGCLDVTNPDNKGLGPTLQFAQKFRNDFAPQLSNADIIAFLGIQALEQGAKNAGGSIQVPYSIGRRDCSAGSLPKRKLPHANHLDSLLMLQREFSLTIPESIALLGCHSLGQGHSDRSGFAGLWDNTPFALDTGYFKNMLGSGWEPKVINNANAKSTAWTRKNSNFLMLHADMILVIGFNITGTQDTPSCTFRTCQKASTHQIVKIFSDNQRLFHQELSRAFKKMIDKSGTGLKPVA